MRPRNEREPQDDGVPDLDEVGTSAALDPPLARHGSRRRRALRRAGLGAAGALGVGLAAMAAQRIGIDNVLTSIVRSNSTWVVIASALMALSLFFRAAAWHCCARRPAGPPSPPSAGAWPS